VPNIRQTLYSEVVAALSGEPQDGPTTVQEAMPVASGLPRTWDEIAAGHLVIAQETLDLGWWEAIVIGRKDDMFTLRFRDYPKTPKFVRHRSATTTLATPTTRTESTTLARSIPTEPGCFSRSITSIRP
jgi:hypothetical protein